MTPTTATTSARAPGRVNLIGEHTDYNGGLCLPFALPVATTATVRVRGDDRLRVRSSAIPQPWTGGPEALAPARRDAVPPWARYVVGVLWAGGEAGWALPGLDVVLHSDVPIGAGLSSSAALECSVALAVAALLDRPVDRGSRRGLAEICRRAENDYVGAPTGGMDQLASLLGRPGHAVLIDFADTTVRSVPLPLADAGLAVLVTDTGSAHTLADAGSGYAQRRQECEAAADHLGLPRLGLAWADDLGRLDDDVLRARARHVLSESGRVEDALQAVAAQDWAGLGSLMTASHTSLCGDFAVSTPLLDLAVDTALDAGALGARLTGGGFGGSTVALLARDAVPAVREAIDAAFAAADHPAPRHLVVTPSAGATVGQSA